MAALVFGLLPNGGQQVCRFAQRTDARIGCKGQQIEPLPGYLEGLIGDQAQHHQVVVATSVGGVPDVVDAERGWLVPPEDPGALARALAEVHSDRKEVARRTERARLRLAEDFGPEPWLDAYERIYRVVAREAAADGTLR